MFEFDLGKIVLFGVVALVVVGPKELPAALRAAGRVMAKARDFRAELRKAVDDLAADRGETRRVNLALDPATAMRGSLPAAAAKRERDDATAQALAYASPEMQAYLAPPAETTKQAEPAPSC